MMVILITGASQGLGLALSKQALERGHTVIATCRKPPGLLHGLMEKYPGQLTAEEMDVSKEESVKSAAGRIGMRFRHIDAIVNNAAVLLESKFFEGDPIAGLPLSGYETTIDVNVMGPIRVLHYFIGKLYLSRNPFILNISSEGAMLKPMGSHYPAYSISKYALNMYTQKLRNYLRESRPDFPARVYMVHPGRMNTVMGVENAQIEPEITAAGLCDILDGATIIPEMEIPFIDYNGNSMPDHYTPN